MPLQQIPFSLPPDVVDIRGEVSQDALARGLLIEEVPRFVISSIDDAHV